MKLGMKAMLVVMFTLLVGACGGVQYTVEGQDRAAGANGTIEVEAQDGGNFVVNLRVEHLLPPARFADDATTYVVWFQAPDQQPQRVGTLAYDEGDRRGEMMATTSFPTFDVIVTGEADPQAVSPSEHVVLRQTVQAQQ